MADTVYFGIKYPTKPTVIIQHRVLGPAFEAFGKRTSVEENIAFLKASYDPKRNYGLFFKSGAKFGLNLPFKLLKQAEDLGNAKDWKNKAWKDIHHDAAEECADLLEGTTVPQFYGGSIDKASDEFKAIHLANLRKKVKVSSKAADLLGVDDHKALTEIAVRMQMQDTKEVDKLTAKLLPKVKPEGNKKPDKKSFLARARKAFG